MLIGKDWAIVRLVVALIIAFLTLGIIFKRMVWGVK